MGQTGKKQLRNYHRIESARRTLVTVLLTCADEEDDAAEACASLNHRHRIVLAPATGRLRRTDGGREISPRSSYLGKGVQAGTPPIYWEDLIVIRRGAPDRVGSRFL